LFAHFDHELEGNAGFLHWKSWPDAGKHFAAQETVDGIARGDLFIVDVLDEVAEEVLKGVAVLLW